MASAAGPLRRELSRPGRERVRRRRDRAAGRRGAHDARPAAGRHAPRARCSYAVGDRYFGLEKTLEGAAIVHSAEIATWFSAQAAGLKARLGFRLVLTVWETIPWLAHVPLAARARLAGAHARGRPISSSRRPSAPATACCSRASRPSASWSPSRASMRSTSRRSPERPPAEPGLVLSPGGWCGRRAIRTCSARSPRCAAGSCRARPDVRLLVVGSGPEGEQAAPLRRRARASRMRSSSARVPYDADAGRLRARLVHGARGLAAARTGRSSSGWCWPRRWQRACRSSRASTGAIPEVVGGPRGRSSRATGSGSRAGDRGGRAAARIAHRCGSRAGVANFSSAAAAERIASGLRTGLLAR